MAAPLPSSSPTSSSSVVWFVIAALILSGRIRVTLDDISLPASAFILVATVSTILGIHRYGMDFKDAVGTVAFLVRWVVYFGWYLFVVGASPRRGPLVGDQDRILVLLHLQSASSRASPR